MLEYLSDNTTNIFHKTVRTLTWQDNMAQSMPKPRRELPGLCWMY